MRNRDRLGLSLSPLLLRVMLGVIFLQAGLGKLLATAEFGPEQAALLAEMGAPAIAAPKAPAPEITEPGPASDPADPQPETASTPPASTEPIKADGPVKVRRLYALSLGIHRAAFPAPLDGGAEVRAIWPKDLAGGGWPKRLAWAVTLTEVLGGACLLLGALTRVWSLGLAGVMIGAMWLTEMGPAIQQGETFLGLLPAHAAWDSAAWKTLWIQFALLMSALALAFLGAGRLSLDALLPGGGGDDE